MQRDRLYQQRPKNKAKNNHSSALAELSRNHICSETILPALASERATSARRARCCRDPKNPPTKPTKKNSGPKLENTLDQHAPTVAIKGHAALLQTKQEDGALPPSFSTHHNRQETTGRRQGDKTRGAHGKGRLHVALDVVAQHGKDLAHARVQLLLEEECGVLGLDLLEADTATAVNARVPVCCRAPLAKHALNVLPRPCTRLSQSNWFQCELWVFIEKNNLLSSE